MIKKNEDSTYYSKYSKVYVCSNCGDEFYHKFKDYDTCMNCHKHIHYEINNKLKGLKVNQELENIKYSEFYVGKSKRKGKKV